MMSFEQEKLLDRIAYLWPGGITTKGRPAFIVQPHFGDTARWFGKANSYDAGWCNRFGAHPALPNVVLGLSVAQHETWCGDAWPKEYNWGAAQKRGLNSVEQMLLRSLPPNPGNVATARRVIEEAIAKNLCPPLDHEALHVDSSPVHGWYWVYFWAFDNDDQGADWFVHVLAQQRPICQAVLMGRNADAVGARALATAMYQTHYYEGVHDPHKMYPGPNGTEVSGVELNIEDYTNALVMLLPGISSSLNGWAPGITTPPAPPAVDPADFNLETTLGVQEALNYLKVPVPPLVEDGINGPHTEMAVRFFQSKNGLHVDGIVGPMTRAALHKALGLP
jgi:hypothetical protein